MAIEFSCSCGRHFRVADDKAGSKGKCPNCGHVVQVPAAAATPPAPRHAAPAPVMAAPAPRMSPAMPSQPVAAPHLTPRPAAGPVYPAPSMPPAAYPAPSYAAPGYPAAQMPAASTEVEAPADNDTIPGFSDAYAAAQTAEAAAALGGYAPQPSYAGSTSSLSGPRGRNAKQRRNLHSNGTFSGLGIALLLGFMLPIVGPSANGSSTHFINLEAIGESHLPLAVRLFFLAPLLASAVVLIVGNMMRGIPRGAIVGATGVVALAVLFIDSDVRHVLDLLNTRNEGSGMMSGMLLLAGCLLMLAGMLGLRRQPDYRPLSIIAIVGGSMFLLSLFIPQGVDNQMPIASLFGGSKPSSPPPSFRSSSGSDEPDALIRVCGILASLGAITTAILCIVFGSTNRFTRQRAKLTLGIASGSLFMVYLMFAFAMNEMLSLAAEGSKATLFVGAMVIVLKMTLWLGVLAVLFSIGLSEMMLGLAEQQQQAGVGFAVQMTGPGQGPPQPPYPGQPYPPQPVYPPQPGGPQQSAYAQPIQQQWPQR